MLVGQTETTFDGNVTMNQTLFFEKSSIKQKIEGSGGDLRLYTNSLQRMTIAESGKIGIADSNPTEILSINGRVKIGDTTAPGDTTNKLYSVSGSLFWNGTDVHTGASATLTAKGDLLTYDTAETRLAVGTNGQFLQADSAQASGVKWATSSATLPLTTKGDVQTYDTADARLGVGTNGQVLTADSVETTGLKWVTPTTYTQPLTTKGDINVYDTADTRLGVGTNGQFLQADSAQASGLKWATSSVTTALTTKGDILMYDTAENRLPIGTQGQVLSADTATASGLKWIGSTSDLWSDNAGNTYVTSSNVGIGTNAPTKLLTLHQATASTDSKITFTNVESTSGVEIGIRGSTGHLQIKQRDNKDIEFYTNDTKSMIIKASGNIGMNVTSPTELLEMDGVMKMRNQTSAPTTTLNKLYSVNGTLYWNGVDLLIGGSGSNVWTQTNNNIYYNTGVVGIGTNNPDSTSALNIITSNKAAINFGGDCTDITNPLGSYYGKVMVNVAGIGRKWIPLYNDDILDEVDLYDVTYNYNTLSAGDVVEFENGSYDKIKITISSSGTEANPIIIKAKTNGSVTFKNQIYVYITGNWVIFNGFKFWNSANHSNGDGKDIMRLEGDNIRITNCEFDGYIEATANEKFIRVDGDNSRIDHCWFHDQVGSGPCIALNRVTHNNPMYLMIDSNIFDTRVDGGGGNGYETIRLGTSAEDESTSLTDGKCMIMNNKFNACDGEIEIISVKCGACIIAQNSFINCKGTVTLRHGNGSFLYFNEIDGQLKSLSGGFRVIGRNHKLFKNYIHDIDGNKKTRCAFSVSGAYDNEATEAVIAAKSLPLDAADKTTLQGYFQCDNIEIYLNFIKNVEQCFVMGAYSKTDNDLGIINCNIHDNICKGDNGFRSDQLGETNTTYTNNVFEVTTLDHSADAGIIEATADFTDLNPTDYGVQGNDFGITNVDPLTNGLGNLLTYYNTLITNMPL